MHRASDLAAAKLGGCAQAKGVFHGRLQRLRGLCVAENASTSPEGGDVDMIEVVTLERVQLDERRQRRGALDRSRQRRR